MDVLFEKVKMVADQPNYGRITLPITAIRGLDVTVLIEKICKENCMCISEETRLGDNFVFIIRDNHHITDDGVWTYFNKVFENVDTDIKIRTMLMFIIRFIKISQIEPLLGRFRMPLEETASDDAEEYISIASLFIDTPHVNTGLDKCCVCHEYTLTKTDDCNHTLCLSCLSQIEKKPCEECEDGIDCGYCDGLQDIRTCPLCRCGITHGLKN